MRLVLIWKYSFRDWADLRTGFFSPISETAAWLRTFPQAFSRNTCQQDQIAQDLQLLCGFLFFTPVPGEPTVRGIRGEGVEWLLRRQ